MGNLLTWSRAVAIGAASALAVAAILGIAQAATDTIYRYSTPKVGALTIDHMAMTSDEGPQVDFNNFGSGGGLHTTAPGTACFNSGVHLPQGSVITALRVYYKSAAPGDLIASLHRQQLDTGTKIKLGETLFEEHSNTRKAGNVPLDGIPASNLTVNNNQYAYGFGICVTADTETFYAARISYTYQQAGD